MRVPCNARITILVLVCVCIQSLGYLGSADCGTDRQCAVSETSEMYQKLWHYSLRKRTVDG